MHRIITPLVRPTYSTPPAQNEDITVLICQRSQPEEIRLCVESIIRFYPDLKIIIVNGAQGDKADNWLRYKASQHPPLSIYYRVGKSNSHGLAMDEGIRNAVKTPWAMLMDSDTIMMRPGLIESSRKWMKSCFAVGALMCVTMKGHAIGDPVDSSDELWYVHPSTCIMKVDEYRLLRPATDHGAPLVYTMIDAQMKGLDVGAVNVAAYVAHLSGASWSELSPIWADDNGVMTRPMVTYINGSICNQTDKDYDIVTMGEMPEKKFIHGQGEVIRRYADRMLVYGDWVCEDANVTDPQEVAKLRATVTGVLCSEERPVVVVINDNTYKLRRLWQSGK